MMCGVCLSPLAASRNAPSSEVQTETAKVKFEVFLDFELADSFTETVWPFRGRSKVLLKLSLLGPSKRTLSQPP